MTPDQALQHFGSQTKLARALGLAQSTVAEWFANGVIPEARQYQVQLASCGALLADQPALRVGECRQIV
jgi:DNA-binding transcriptional regulator YdaS (Cro superfamily)